MMGKQHVFFGMATATAMYAIMHETGVPYFDHPLFLVGGSIIGSLVPDIDNPKATISQYFPLLSKIINKLFGHRMLFHDVAAWGFVLVIVAVTLLGNYPILFGFMWGVFGHLLLDAYTVRGIPMLVIFHKKMRDGSKRAAINLHLVPKFMRVKADSKAAWVVTVLVTALVIAGMYELGTIWGDLNLKMLAI